jgi:hypothetical protein
MKTLVLSNKAGINDWDKIKEVLKEPLAKLDRELEIKRVDYDNLPREEINPGQWGISRAFMKSLIPLARGYETFIFHDPNFKKELNVI